jgi:hypothetical protein
MTYSLHQHEQTPPKREETQLGKLFSFKDKKACYRKNYLGWDNIERVNQQNYRTKKTKYLNKQALAVMAAIVPKLERGERVIFNHKYLSSITLCKRRQNQNIIQELKIVLDIEYHNSVTHKGKKYRHSYEFLYKQQKQENISSSENSIGQFFARQTPPILYIENKDIEYRSKNVQEHESNFLQNSVSLDLAETIKQGKTSKVIPLKLKPICNKRKKPTNAEIKAKQAKFLYFKQYDKPKNLGDHYPLRQEDCAKLQITSGRDFTLNAMNEILLDMSRKAKLQGHSFVSKARFMAYMATVYRYEGRDAVKTANSAFKLLTRATEAEIIQHTTQAERESYLNLVEQQAITHRSDETQYRAKLVGSLKPSQAYNFLSSLGTIRRVGEILELHMSQDVLFTDYSLERILSDANAVGGYCGVEKLEIIVKNDKEPSQL